MVNYMAYLTAKGIQNLNILEGMRSYIFGKAYTNSPIEHIGLTSGIDYGTTTDYTYLFD